MPVIPTDVVSELLLDRPKRPVEEHSPGVFMLERSPEAIDSSEIGIAHGDKPSPDSSSFEKRPKPVCSELGPSVGEDPFRFTMPVEGLAEECAGKRRVGFTWRDGEGENLSRRGVEDRSDYDRSK